MFAGEENLWFLDALKCSISELIFFEKTWKGIKNVFFKISVTTEILELLNFSAEFSALNSALRYENLHELPPDNRIFTKRPVCILLSANSSLIEARTQRPQIWLEASMISFLKLDKFFVIAEGCFRQIFLYFGDQNRWLLLALYRLSSYTITIAEGFLGCTWSWLS